MRLVIDGSKTLGNVAIARESGAPSLICSQMPPHSDRSLGSLMRTDKSRTASPAERPLVARSCKASRNGRHSRRLKLWGAVRRLVRDAATLAGFAAEPLAFFAGP